MSRSMQLIGLKPGLDHLTKGEPVTGIEFVTRYYDTGKIEQDYHRFSDSSVKVSVCGGFEGGFGEVYDLHKYDHGSTFYTEYVQETVWSSGPVIFLALHHADTDTPVKTSLWTEKEMAKYL